jgi:hypothetical protein
MKDLIKCTIKRPDKISGTIIARAEDFIKNKKYDEADLMTWDIETYELNPNHIALSDLYNGIEHITHYTIEAFYEYVKALNIKYQMKDKYLIIMAHNGQKFDFLALAKYIFFNDIEYHKNGDIIFLKMGNIIFKDSINLLRGSLKNLSKSFLKDEDQKLELPSKFINPKRMVNQDTKEIYSFNKDEYKADVEAYNKKVIDSEDIKYCQRDTEALFNILTHEKLKKYNLDWRNYNTIASISFDLLNKQMIEENKKRFNNPNVDYSYKIDRYIDRVFETLYRGGYTYVFKHESSLKQVACFDFNSMYAYVMTENFGTPENLKFYNLADERVITKFVVRDWQEMMKNCPHGTSRVEIKIKDKYLNDESVMKILRKIGHIQFNKENAGMNFYDFADGNKYIIDIMNVELSVIMDFYEITLLETIFSKDYYKPFANYINDKYERRREANLNKNSSEAEILKAYLTNCYGRFGMRTSNEGQKSLQDIEKVKDFIYERTINAIKKHLLKEDVIKAALDKIEESFKAARFKTNDEYELAELKKDRDSKVNELLETEAKKVLYANFDKPDSELKFINRFDNHTDQERYCCKLITFLNDNYKIYNCIKINMFNLFEEVLENGEKYSTYIINYDSEKEPYKTSSFYFASEITAKSRALLIKNMLEIEFSGVGEVCYCDTDSIHIDTNDVSKVEAVLRELGTLDTGNKKIGMLKNEGVFSKFYWFAKKHYYGFHDVNSFVLDPEAKKYHGANYEAILNQLKGINNNPLLLSKAALKGFKAEKNIDTFIDTRAVINIRKLPTRYKNYEFTRANVLLESKTFLNFVVHNDRYLNLFKYTDHVMDITQEKQVHQDLLKRLFKYMRSSNIYVFEDNKIFKVIEELPKRIEEIKAKYKWSLENGVYDFAETRNLPKEIIKDIQKLTKKIEKKKQNDLSKLSVHERALLELKKEIA